VDGELPPPQESSPRKGTNTNVAPMKLDPGRQNLIEEFPHIPEKPLQEFLETYVPSVDEEVVDRVMKELKANTKLTKNGWVRGYATKTPAQMRIHENVAFSNLCLFITAIIEAAVKLEDHSNNPWIAHSSKKGTLVGEKASTTSCIYLPEMISDGHSMGWEQLLAVGEFKKHRIHEKHVWFFLRFRGVYD
jgi:hypothetical protein